MVNLGVVRDYLIENRIDKEIKQNITCLMNEILLVYFGCDLTECTGIFENREFKPALEFYLVSEYLYRNLKERKQPVAEFQNLFIWGRLGTGYSLTQEEVLINIFGGKTNEIY